MVESGASQSRRRPRRSQTDVVDAALRILDGKGLPDLTMRHLAETLHVQPSALYWHFSSKQALLAAVSRRILEPLAANTPVGSLADAAAALGFRLRECLLTYRDGAELVSSSLALGLVDPPLLSPLLTVSGSRGVSEPLISSTAETMTHYTVGYAFHEQQRRQADAIGVLDVLDSSGASEAGRRASENTAFAAGIALISAGVTASLHHQAD